MNQNIPQNGHRRVQRRGVEQRDWQATAKEALGALSKMDVPNVIRKNPYPALAIAGAAGLLVGITAVSYTHLRAHETSLHLVFPLLH